MKITNLFGKRSISNLKQSRQSNVVIQIITQQAYQIVLRKENWYEK